MFILLINSEDQPFLAWGGLSILPGPDAPSSEAVCQDPAFIRANLESLPRGAWHHIALVRSGSTTEAYYDGVLDATVFTGYYTLAAPSSYLRVGEVWTGPSYTLNGWIDELRFSKGIARWTTFFIPPTQEYGPASTGTVGSHAHRYSGPTLDLSWSGALQPLGQSRFDYVPFSSRHKSGIVVPG